MTSSQPPAGRAGATPAGPETVRRELQAEQRHVDRVYEALDVATASARQVAKQGSQLYQSDRTNFVREEDGTALFERDAFAFQSARRLAVLDAEHEGLVFGRLDLNEPETRYIGRIGVRDDDYEPLVIDWRAPAAEPFYRATPAEPMGVVRRRVLRCRNDKVIGIEDDLLDAGSNTDLVVVGEGALMAALKRARGDAMRDIVATIQSEQDEAIRAPYQGVTVIAGGPGTGKTVVALHRAAYLLYSHRRRLEKGGVLVVGPSALFMNYIERVLPSLGEDSVTLRAVGDLAHDVLGFAADDVDDAAAATLKGSLRMLDVLRALVREPVGDADLRLQVSVKGEVLTLEPRRLRQIRNEVLAHQVVNRAKAHALKLVLNALWDRYTNEDELAREQFDDLVGSSAQFTMFSHAWWPSLEAADVLLRLADPDVLATVAPRHSEQEREALASSYRQVAEGRRGWTVADVALLDELVSMVGLPDHEHDEDRSVVFEGGGDVAELVSTADLLSRQREVDPDQDPWETYAHVLVDEAQDVTPMQWRMLRRRGPQASWTLVGDPAQSSYPHADETDEALRTLVGRSPFREFRLSTNYRSPSEVFELAAQVITRVHPDADLPHAIRTTGIQPLLSATDPARMMDSVSEHVNELRGQVEGTIGVVVPPSLFGDVSKALAERTQTEPIRVVTPLQVKGLEYDAALVVSPDDIVAEAPGGERVLYVALTRPTQRLVTLDLVERGRAPARWREALV
ncbi:HelD family protein [Aestuariimicrobium ganziense]|uniref:HelD family protein n=1 Tax=Aestuariimicrobium ganziense TaxID=2773677 RepID=UPI0019433D4F|nr:UvrD-helicase domain-containing protein [Aestuariimicrobium ganziense]